MKAQVLHRTYVNEKTLPERYRDQMTHVMDERKGVPVAVFAVGAIIDGPLAIQMVSNGQAAPCDDECRSAVNLSPEQLRSLRLENEMAEKGIRKEDRELYLKGVISGYDAAGNYARGPQWDTYHAALKQDEDDEL